MVWSHLSTSCLCRCDTTLYSWRWKTCGTCFRPDYCPESASMKKLRHGAERMIVGCCNLGTLRWLRKKFNSVKIFELFFSLSSDMRYRVVLLQEYTLSINQSWLFFAESCIRSIKLGTMEIYVDGPNNGNQLKINYDLRNSTTAVISLRTEQVLPSVGGQPLVLFVWINEVDPLFIASYDWRRMKRPSWGFSSSLLHDASYICVNFIHTNN